MIEKPALVWLREDLRFDDNPALRAAADRGGAVACLYVLDDEVAGEWKMGGAQRWWLHHSLSALQDDFEKFGGTLILRRGNAGMIVPQIAEELGAGAVYWNRRYMPWQIEQDKALKEQLSEDFEVKSFNGRLLNEPWEICTKSGGPYKVYTPYWKQVQQRDIRDPLAKVQKLEAPSRVPDTDKLDDWGLLPTRPNWAEGFEPVWTPGERGARRRWLDWLKSEGAKNYASHRNRPDLDHTSRMAPHIHFGEISPVTMYREMQQKIEDGDIPQEEGNTFLSELAWREFSYNLLYHFGHMFDEPLMDKFKGFEWDNDEDKLEAWKKGQTGYPIVDAGMRQLWTEGHMHNRVRMIVGSFLVKDLLVDWRKGMKWFWDTLVCADPASNTASWQWVAGCGADAAPFFRVFNPITQGEKFDPDGDYVRRHVPELKDMPKKHIHAPWQAPKDVLRKAGVELGKDYPEPIVDHGKMREEALSRYKAIK
ncbi:cryptochrome/photolyase family protein [Parvularcula lutaonensis]|uniref:Cryptochrome/photolyase family protein n=1 Tax=Parvularcula lutaonensis TaxID=491923 RepID=A0ABV7MDG6_9PROT|nr:deoxyribodipyrimidine photo-lyase [Parvularcula lutaonensis]GGY39790.1 deoxyribodipyrimidine photo-lyase [Parvularcula lutaonensis]